jgi:hypothetical protein
VRPSSPKNPGYVSTAAATVAAHPSATSLAGPAVLEIASRVVGTDVNLCDYERRRAANVARNNAELMRLGFNVSRLSPSLLLDHVARRIRVRLPRSCHVLQLHALRMFLPHGREENQVACIFLQEILGFPLHILDGGYNLMKILLMMSW